MARKNYVDEDIHSEDLQEIIAKPPSWLLQRGIGFILLTILLIFGLSFFIRYPEAVHVKLRFNTLNAPKVVISKSSVQLTELLVPDGSWVKAHQDLAYLESTANHRHVLEILARMKKYRESTMELGQLEEMISPNALNLGELQGGYYNFFLAYLSFRAVDKTGVFEKKRNLLLDEMENVSKQEKYLKEGYGLQKKELELVEGEFEKYRILADKKIISSMELRQKEALLLAKRQSIPQIENNLIGNQGNLLSKRKELSDIDNQILDEKKKFVQALNSFISEAENWKKQYVLTAPEEGKLIYASFLQNNQLIIAGQELFYINPDGGDYYGEVYIPQDNSSRIKQDQEVIIKVHSYPHQEYGFLRGRISYISDIPVLDSVFFSKVELLRTPSDSVIRIKPGIRADAEIITEDQSVFNRVWNSVIKSLRF